MTSPYETVCSAIRDAGYKVRASGHRAARSQCPGHDSSGYSLSIREADDEAVLLYCFAGCELDDVLAAVDLARRDLFPVTGRRWSL